MLVLGRKVDQAIVIPEFDIRIVITQVSHGAARLGITAPRHIEIVREELHEARMAAKEAAAPPVAYIDIPLVEQPAEDASVS